MRRRWYAQSGEDRIVSKLFRRIGTTNEVAVEVGALDGIDNSNTAAFRDRGWRTFLFDTWPLDPMVRYARMTAENVNETFSEAGIPFWFDLLSIDIDGNDLWVWRALRFRPRVVIIEYNQRWNLKKSRTVAYDPAFAWDGSCYYGASAPALVALGAEKGYTLYASTRSNLIFTEAGLAPELSIRKIKRIKKFKRPDELDRKWVEYP